MEYVLERHGAAARASSWILAQYSPSPESRAARYRRLPRRATPPPACRAGVGRVSGSTGPDSRLASCPARGAARLESRRRIELARRRHSLSGVVEPATRPRSGALRARTPCRTAERDGRAGAAARHTDHLHLQLGERVRAWEHMPSRPDPEPGGLDEVESARGGPTRGCGAGSCGGPSGGWFSRRSRSGVESTSASSGASRERSRPSNSDRVVDVLDHVGADDDVGTHVARFAQSWSTRRSPAIHSCAGVSRPCDGDRARLVDADRADRRGGRRDGRGRHRCRSPRRGRRRA